MKIKSTLLPLTLSVCAALSAPVMAQSASINITGEISNDICDITINGSSTNTATIQLRKVTGTEMPQVGDTAGDTPLDIALTNCDTAVVSDVQISFSSPNADAVSARIGTGVQGVSFQIFSRDRDQQIAVEQTGSSRLERNSYFETVDANGAANLAYGVRYYREAAGNLSGQLTATANLTIAYM